MLQRVVANKWHTFLSNSFLPIYVLAKQHKGQLQNQNKDPNKNK
jgi:hypothetical protein